MFDESETIEFFNRIINNQNIDEQEIRTNVTKFYEYLELTQMCDDETLQKLGKIVTCLPEILAIKRTMGFIDVSSLLVDAPEEQKKLSKKPRKYYNHYVNERFSGGCGSVTRRTVSSSCGGFNDDSGSSSCGGSIYTRRC